MNSWPLGNKEKTWKLVPAKLEQLETPPGILNWTICGARCFVFLWKTCNAAAKDSFAVHSYHVTLQNTGLPIFGEMWHSTRVLFYDRLGGGRGTITSIHHSDRTLTGVGRFVQLKFSFHFKWAQVLKNPASLFLSYFFGVRFFLTLLVLTCSQTRTSIWPCKCALRWGNRTSMFLAWTSFSLSLLDQSFLSQEQEFYILTWSCLFFSFSFCLIQGFFFSWTKGIWTHPLLVEGCCCHLAAHADGDQCYWNLCFGPFLRTRSSSAVTVATELSGPACHGRPALSPRAGTRSCWSPAWVVYPDLF